MTNSASYPLGVPGKPWGVAERNLWFSQQIIKRSYQDEVLGPLKAVDPGFTLSQYGALDIDATRYPLFVAHNRIVDPAKPTALITGGVHGYETSGVQGALRFLLTKAVNYAEHFNLIITPCISPWGYETINRWNPQTIDPNRSFIADSPAQESALLMQCVAELTEDVDHIDVHIDLHETTDTDNTVFRPALAARDNVEHAIWDIPDGFYLVGDTENPCTDFQAHIIQAVEQVTHIAPHDADGRLIGEKVAQRGVINYPTTTLGLCTGFSHARFNTTTEVYPDSPQVDDENCIQAQVEAVCSGLDYVIDTLPNTAEN